MKKTLTVTLALVVSLLAYRQATSQPTTQTTAETMDRSAAATYEHLATAIIAIEATEDELVKSILLGYNAAAQGRLKAAVADQAGRRCPPGSRRELDRRRRQRRGQANPVRPPAPLQGRSHTQYRRKHKRRLHVHK